MKKTLLILFFCFISAILFAQHIKGRVIQAATNELIPNARITVIKISDKALVSSTFSNDAGDFSVEIKGKPSSYYLEITADGFQYEKVTLNNTDPLLIKLTASKSLLVEEVTVVAGKKAITLNGDKISYDLQQMGIGMGNNGLEALQQLPSITLDKDENIQFRGSAGVQIMINGKKSMLQGDALREFIRSLNGNDIKAVEVIAQPSARYEATGTTGILNIVLHKNNIQTLGGSIYSNASYGKYFKSRSGARIFYNDDKWSVNANGSYYDGESFNDREVNQTIQSINGVRNINQTNYWNPKTKRGSFNFGVERKLDKNHLVSTEWQYYKENYKANTDGKTVDSWNKQVEKEVILTKKDKNATNQVTGNIFYSFTSDSATTKIDAQVNYGYFKTAVDGFQQNTFSLNEIDRLDGLKETQYNMTNAQVDWAQKIKNNLNLEVGAKYTYVDMNYFNKYDVAPGSHFTIPDSLMINDFKYKEKLTAAYTQLNYSWQKWNFLAGLRMENYRYEAYSNTNKQKNTDNYTNWFPSASVSYEHDNNQYRISYSKRIARPDYLSLNPYFEYLDAYSIQKGNPNLKPQMYHSFELNYIFKNSFSFGLYGNVYNDGFINVVDYQEQENYTILYKSNASKGSRYGFSASIPYKIGKWWSMQYNVDAYLTSENSSIKNYTYKGKGHGYDINTYQRFTLPKSWLITWNGFIYGHKKTETGYRPMFFDFSTSVQKSFMADKIQVNAGCNNILKKSMYNAYSTVGNVSTHWVNKWETRSFYVQMTYRFGGNKEKKIKGTGLDQEQNRM